MQDEGEHHGPCAGHPVLPAGCVDVRPLGSSACLRRQRRGESAVAQELPAHQACVDVPAEGEWSAGKTEERTACKSLRARGRKVEAMVGRACHSVKIDTR